MKKFIIVILLFFSFFNNLKAADSGFKYYWGLLFSMTSSMDKTHFYYEFANDITYLFPFMNLELGVGFNYFYKQHIIDNKSIYNYTLSDGSKTEIKLSSINDRNLFPSYIVARYNFDILEDGYIVLDLKYGTFFNNYNGDYIISLVDNNSSIKLSQKYNIDNFNYYAISTGYELDNFMISLEYRVSEFLLTYSLNEGANELVSQSNKERAHYIGLRFIGKYDLF